MGSGATCWQKGDSLHIRKYHLQNFSLPKDYTRIKTISVYKKVIQHVNGHFLGHLVGSHCARLMHNVYLLYMGKIIEKPAFLCKSSLN